MPGYEESLITHLPEASGISHQPGNGSMECDPVVLKYAEPSQEEYGARQAFEVDTFSESERFRNFTIPRDSDLSLPYPLIELIHEVAEEQPAKDGTPEIRALFRDVWFPPVTPKISNW